MGLAPGADVVLAQLDILAAASGGTMHALSGGAVDPLVSRLSIFVLAVGVADLPSGSGPLWARALGIVALVFASINIFGGFLVTQRMLGMYRKKGKAGASDER